jgi:hypothetical protein
MMKFDWSEMTEDKVKTIRALCPPDEYRVLSPTACTGLFPPTLLVKFDSVLLVGSGISGTNCVVYMMNGHRLDAKDDSIDQQPLGFACVGDSPTTSGCLIQHGDWNNRSTPIPNEFFDYLRASQLGNCYPITELPAKPSGPLSDLVVRSQREALQTLADELKRSFGTFTLNA